MSLNFCYTLQLYTIITRSQTCRGSYVEFDNLTRELGLFKVETIGDACKLIGNAINLRLHLTLKRGLMYMDRIHVESNRFSLCRHGGWRIA